MAESLTTSVPAREAHGAIGGIRTHLAVLGAWTHQVALALWLGGIAVAGGVAAPAIFGSARKAGDTHWGTPLYNFAGEAAGVMFGRLNYLALVCAVLALISGLLYARAARFCRVRSTVRAVLTLVALGLVTWLTFGVYEQMLGLRAAGDMQAFDGLHRLYSSVYLAQGVLILTVMALTNWMHLDR